jgi:hypothetical protein
MSAFKFKIDILRFVPRCIVLMRVTVTLYQLENLAPKNKILN